MRQISLMILPHNQSTETHGRNSIFFGIIGLMEWFMPHHVTEQLNELLRQRILVLDGAMGTMIQQKDLTAQDFGGP